MKRHLLLMTLLIFGQFAIGQDTIPILYRQYATQAYMKALLAGNPEMQEKRSTIERHTFDFLRYGLPDTAYIKVVVHLIGNAALEITPEDVQVQLSILNAAFYLPDMPFGEDQHPAWTAEHFHEKAARTAICFCLADRNPAGNPTTGLLYVPSPVTSFPVGTDMMAFEGGGSVGWDSGKYLNIYVAYLEKDVAGFAQMPGGPAISDGIVIHPSFFARKDLEAFVAMNPSMENYSLGKTLVHLAGSYLNLYELWNDDQPCADDYTQRQ